MYIFPHPPVPPGQIVIAGCSFGTEFCGQLLAAQGRHFWARLSECLDLWLWCHKSTPGVFLWRGSRFGVHEQPRRFLIKTELSFLLFFITVFIAYCAKQVFKLTCISYYSWQHRHGKLKNKVSAVYHLRIHIWQFIVCTVVINYCLSIILTHFYIPVNIVRDLPWFINIFYRHVWNAILLRFCSNSVCNNFFKRHLQNILTLYVYIIIMQLFSNEVIILIKKKKKKWNAYSSDRH